MATKHPIRICKYCKTSFLTTNNAQAFCSDYCRLWNKIKVGSQINCWEWLASKTEDGYGAFKFKGRMETAHRVVWHFTYGKIPNKLRVLHHCDNPSCCNPTHLFLGTQVDNVQDMVSKNRVADHRGEANPRSKLTEKQIIKIRKQFLDGERPIDLAHQYKVAFTTICCVRDLLTWKHI